MAGLAYDASNSLSYLPKTWTLSPGSGDNSYSMQIITGNKLTLGGLWTNTYRLASPVINLRSDLIYVDGIGTENNPYQIALP